MGHLDEALNAFNQAMVILQAHYGANHLNVGLVYGNIGAIMQMQGKLMAARVSLDHAVRVCEQALGHDHPTVATLVSNLAEVLRQSGDLPGAKAAVERALAIDLALLGAAASQRGRALRQPGAHPPGAGRARPPPKKPCARRWRSTWPHFGERHQRIASRLNGLGVALREQGRAAEALPLLERAYATGQEVFAPSRWKCPTSRPTWAWCCRTWAAWTKPAPPTGRPWPAKKARWAHEHRQVGLRLSLLAEHFTQPWADAANGARDAPPRAGDPLAAACRRITRASRRCAKPSRRSKIQVFVTAQPSEESYRILGVIRCEAPNYTQNSDSFPNGMSSYVFFLHDWSPKANDRHWRAVTEPGDEWHMRAIPSPGILLVVSTNQSIHRI